MAKTKKPTSTPSLFGVDLRSPAVPSVSGGGLGGNLNLRPNPLQAAQDAANRANDLRYGQGIGVLAGGQQAATGLIGQALADTKGMGAAQYRQIERTREKDLAGDTQSAISRGLGNTTILQGMQNESRRRAQDATLGVDSAVQQARNNLLLQQAQQQSRGAGDIANFISARNDIQPDISQFAALQQAASAARPLSGSSGPVTQEGIFGRADPVGAQASRIDYDPRQFYSPPGTGHLAGGGTGGGLNPPPGSIPLGGTPITSAATVGSNLSSPGTISLRPTPSKTIATPIPQAPSGWTWDMSGSQPRLQQLERQIMVTPTGSRGI